MVAGPDHILRLIAFGLGGLAALAAAFEFRDAVAPESPAASVPIEDPLRATLRRCRALTVEEIETDTVCREAWAENRRRFFAPVGSEPGVSESGREEE